MGMITVIKQVNTSFDIIAKMPPYVFKFLQLVNGPMNKFLIECNEQEG